MSRARTWFVSRPGSDYLFEGTRGARDRGDEDYCYLSPRSVEDVFGIRMPIGVCEPQERSCDLVRRTRRSPKGRFKPDRKPAKRRTKR